MANYGQMVLTNLGLVLYTKAQSGTPIVFTKMGVGSGQVPSGQNPQDLTALIQSDFDVVISNIQVDTVNLMAYIKGTTDNQDISAELYICELGLFATDPDVGEILYGYANAGTSGDYIPPISTGLFTRQFQVNAAIGNATSVTAVIPQNVYATQIELDTLAGGGWTDETVKGNADAISNLAGVGRTVETVRGNAVAIAATNEALAEHQADYAQDTGSANAYAIALDPAPVAYTVGKIYKFKATNANTGASTFAIGALAATPIKKNVSTALVAGDIPTGGIIPVVYDGTNFQLIPMVAPTISDASTTTKGIIEIATDAEVTTGTSTTLAVTPAGAKVELDKKARILQSSFVGDDSASRDIVIGFTPKIVFVYTSGSFWTLLSVGIYSPSAGMNASSYIQSNGMKVSTSSGGMNISGVTYNYIALV